MDQIGSTEEFRSGPVLFGPVIGILPMDGLTGSKQCPEKDYYRNSIHDLFSL
jgi:hypothetical protein